MKKLGFVIPWYFENINGGAETEMKGIVDHLHAQNVDLEVLTTCVKEFHSDWGENYYKPGLDQVSGVDVRRFPVEKRDSSAFDKVNLKLMNDKPVTAAEEEIFMREFVKSPALTNYIHDHKNEYSLFIYIPYMFSTNYYGILAAPEKSVLIPCFHEEAYIHMGIYKKAFENLAGMLFLSQPEKELANRVFDLKNVKQLVMGAGVDTDFKMDGERFRTKFNIHDPFILYAGRKDVGKNIYLLLQYFDQYLKRHKNSKLKLVLIGGGDMYIPEELKNDVIDLGFVDLQDKHDAYAAASIFCQPSKHESFSIVIMESWLAEKPVLVHEKCDVTKNFCVQTNGGLWFNNYFEFEKEVEMLLGSPELAKSMGENGRKYVLENFSWNVITGKLMKFFKDICEGELDHE